MLEMQSTGFCPIPKWGAKDMVIAPVHPTDM